MGDRSPHYGWVFRYSLVAMVAAGAGWGVNQLAVWQVEQRLPDPERMDPLAADLSVDGRAESGSPPPAVDPNVVVERAAIDPGTALESAAGAAGGHESKQAPPRQADGEIDQHRPAEGDKTGRCGADSAPKSDDSIDPSGDGGSDHRPIHVFSVDRSKLEQTFDSPGHIADHAVIMPNIQGGRRRGMRFTAVAPRGIFSRLGIQNGDVVLSVNGAPITTQQKAIAGLRRMRKLQTFNVVLKRNGQLRRHRYLLE